MECRNCPYGKEDFERRMYWYEKIVNEEGVPNSIYGYETYEDAAKEANQFLWCDKVGGKVYCFGHCEDVYSNTESQIVYSKKARKSKREREIKYRNRLKYLAENCGNWYPCAAYPVDKYGNYVHDKEWFIWFPDDEPQEVAYYKRQYRGKRSKWLKKQSNRKIRRNKGELPNGYRCHRLFDFWWEYD